ncbi:hypothetical protein J4526_08265 [Desulfurococcaceae archaeon MEX13E-LK6-19]|nr:hypothetical protein J4526_08265 [Desulfurococcaceae archaeon MEX13E-LK6-19]
MRKDDWIRIYPQGLNEDAVKNYCRECREETKEQGKPSPKAMNCWKTVYEVEYEDLFTKALDKAKKIVLETKHCWLEARKPDEYTGRKGAIIIVCWDHNEFRETRRKIIEEYMKEQLIEEPYLPYRRGGNYYDKEYGPWRLWALKYYPEKLPVQDIIELKIVCPNDSTPMEREAKGFKCGLCGLYIPETIIYEAIELGEAEYKVKTGFHKNNVYTLKYRPPDRVEIVRKQAERELSSSEE